MPVCTQLGYSELPEDTTQSDVLNVVQVEIPLLRELEKNKPLYFKKQKNVEFLVYTQLRNSDLPEKITQSDLF